MIAFEVSETIQRPAEVVFTCLAESDASQWEPNVVEQRPTSAGTIGVGTTGVNVRRVAGQMVETTWIVTAYAPPNSFTVKSTSGPVSYELTYRCEPLDDATRCTVQFSGEPKGFFRIAEPLLAHTIKSDFAEDLARLKSYLEGQS
jgi:hypothetical protein